MAARTAYPPVRVHTSEQISPSLAQEMVVRYLERSATDASLHPDSTLAATSYVADDDDDEGIRFPQTGPNGGLILHFLRRLEAGLRGEDLVAQSREELAALFNDDIPEQPEFEKFGSTKKSKREQSVEKVADWSDAMDAEQYANEQEVVDEEIGDNLEGTGEQAPEPRVKTAKLDPAARKAAKKARKKALKQSAQKG